MPDDELLRKLEGLLERVERIERRLEMDASDASEQDEDVPLVTQLTRAKSGVGDPPPTAPPVVPPAIPSAKPPTAPQTAPPTTPPDRHRPQRAEVVDRDGASAMELLIGAKWAAWIGAIVIVFATALLIKLGYDAGLWGELSKTTRCLLIAGFGFSLLILGELALRRISRPASVGLFGAGLGVLYLDAWATAEFFDLLSRGGSFALMAVVAAGAFLITLRTKSLTIGVLALVGGYLAPIIVSRVTGHDIEIAAFLTGMLSTALALSFVSPRPFRSLRYVALGGQCIVGFLWIVSSGAAVWLMSIIFVCLWWSMLLVEVTAAALRRQSPRGGPIAILLATAAVVTAVCSLLVGAAPAGDAWPGIFTAAIAALGAATALQFGPGLDSLRETPSNAMDKLAIALWAQFGVLLVVAIALQFDGFGLNVGWLAIGVAAIEVGRRLPSRGVDVFGLIVWALAMGLAWIQRGVMVLGGTTGLSGKILSTSWLRFDKWSLLMVIGIVVTLVMAHRLRGTPARPRRVMPVLLAAIATSSWFGLCLVQCTPLAATAAWLAAVVVLLFLAPFGRRQRYLEIAIVALFVTAAKWLLVDMIADRFDGGWQPHGRSILANGQMALALGLSATGLWVAWILYRRRAVITGADASPKSATWMLPLIGSVLLVLCAFSFEIDRAVSTLGGPQLETMAIAPPLLRALWWTALWTVGGTGLVIAGRQAPFHRLHECGLVLLAGSAFAWLAYDTLAWRLMEGTLATRVVLNLQFAVGVLLAVALAVTARWGRPTPDDRPVDSPMPLDPAAFGFALLGLVGLWLGSLEIDRAFAAEQMVRQAGLSVFWAVYGVLLVIVGFIYRTAAARYAGLALLALTVLKVVFVDLATIQEVWRVISFLTSGLLLVGTSVLYTKLSPRLLASRGEDDAS